MEKLKKFKTIVQLMVRLTEKHRIGELSGVYSRGV